MNVHRLLCCVLLLICVTTVALPMPPHPELLARIRAGEIAEPYAMSHRSELLARGVDSPPADAISRLRQRALDEDLNILAILVDFSDNGAHTAPDYFDGLLFGEEFGTLRHYYEQISYGSLTLVTVNLPSTLEWARAPHTYAYYVDGQNGFGQYPQNAQGLAEDAVLAVDPVVNYDLYDNNNDGEVDALFIIHAGPGAERTGNPNHIWSHKWQMGVVNVDNVYCDVYSMEPEFWNSPGDMTCGVYAHEMGHSVFFLPDLYDYDYDSEGLGTWSLMAGGSWNGALGRSPAHPDAQSRVQMGFVEPIRVTSGLLSVTIPPVEIAPVIYELWTDGLNSSEHFLVENRQRLGYDLGLGSEGLMIYHVDENVWGNDAQWFPGHTNAGHYRVALEQADGLWNLERNQNGGDGGDPFPGSTGNTMFKASSTPGSRSYNDLDSQVSVRRIRAEGDSIVASLLVSTDEYVFVNTPMTGVESGTEGCVPVVVENSVTGRGIQSFSFTLVFDPALITPVAPYYDLAGALVPPSWNLLENHSNPGEIQISGAGSTPLTGLGDLLCLRLAVSPTAVDGSVSPLRFQDFTISGTSLLDTTSGSLTALAPLISTHPAGLAFGYIEPGQTDVLSLVVRNLGHVNLSVNAVQIGAPFTSDFSGSLTVEPNRWAILRVLFTPTGEVWYQDTLRIFSNNPAGAARIVVTGQGTLTAGDDPPAALPEQFYLSQNYPNPFNPATQFQFGLPAPARVTLSLYDVLGREVAVLVDGALEAGHHRISWDGREAAAGIYLAVLRGDGFSIVRKAMLVK